MKLEMILLLLGTLTVTTIAAPFSGQQQPQQQKENVDQLIEETKRIADEAGIASNTIFRYIVRNKT